MPKGCYPRKYSTETRVDGRRTQVYVISCPCFKVKDPNHKGVMNFLSKRQRDLEMKKHL